MKKRMTAVLLAVALVFSLAGCAMGNKDVPYKKGHWTGGQFVSKYLGFTVTVPEDWTISDNEQLRKLTQQEKDGVIYDMKAVAQDGSRISIMGENLSMTSSGVSIDEKKYAEALKEQYTSRQDTIYQVGEVDEVSLLGERYVRLPVKIGDSQAVQWHLLRKIDNNMAVILITAKDEDTVKTISNYFKTIENAEEDASSASSGSTQMTFRRGSWTGDVFTNKSMGFSLTLPGEWEKMSGKELSSMAGGETADETDALTSADGFTNQTTYDFGVKGKDGSTVVILAEDLSQTTSVQAFDAWDYADFVTEQLSGTKNFGYVMGDPEEITLAGQTYVKVPMTAQDGKVTQWYLLRHMGMFMTAIVCTTSSTDVSSLDAVLNAMLPMEADSSSDSSSQPDGASDSSSQADSSSAV